MLELRSIHSILKLLNDGWGIFSSKDGSARNDDIAPCNERPKRGSVSVMSHHGQKWYVVCGGRLSVKISIVQRSQMAEAQSLEARRRGEPGKRRGTRTCFCADMHGFRAQPSVDFNILLGEPSTKLSDLRYAAIEELLSTSA